MIAAFHARRRQVVVALVALLALGVVTLLFQKSVERNGANVPNPFGVSNPSLMVGSLTEVGERRGVRVRIFSFDDGAEAEVLQGATHVKSMDFVLTPDDDTISDGASLCSAISSGKRFFGYKYTSRDASIEKEAAGRVAGAPISFAEQFPGTFFASQEERTVRSFVQEFEVQKGVVFRDPCTVTLDRNARYIVLAEDTDVVFRSRGLDVPVETGEEMCTNSRDDNRDGFVDGPGTSLLSETVFRGFPFVMPDNSIDPVTRSQLVARVGDMVIYDLLRFGYRRPSLVAVEATNGEVRQYVSGIFPTLNDTRLTLSGEEIEMAEVAERFESGSLPTMRTCELSQAQRIHAVAVNTASHTSSTHVVHIKVNTQECVVLAIATGIYTPFKIYIETLGSSAIAGILTDDALIVNAPAQTLRIERYIHNLPLTYGRASGVTYYVEEAKRRFGITTVGTTQIASITGASGFTWTPRRGFVVGEQSPGLTDPRWSTNGDKQWWWLSGSVVHNGSIYLAYSGVRVGDEAPTGVASLSEFDGYIVRVDVDAASSATVTSVQRMPSATPFPANLIYDAERGVLLAELRGVAQRPLLVRMNTDNLTILESSPLFADQRDSGMTSVLSSGAANFLHPQESIVSNGSSLYVLSDSSLSRIDLTGNDARRDRSLNARRRLIAPVLDNHSSDIFYSWTTIDGSVHTLARVDGTSLATESEISLPSAFVNTSTALLVDSDRERLLLLSPMGAAVYDLAANGLRLIAFRSATSSNLIIGNLIMGSVYPWRSYDRKSGLLYGASDGASFTINAISGAEEPSTASLQSDTWLRALMTRPASALITYDTTDNDVFLRSPRLGPPLLRTEALCNP